MCDSATNYDWSFPPKFKTLKMKHFLGIQTNIVHSTIFSTLLILGQILPVSAIGEGFDLGINGKLSKSINIILVYDSAELTDLVGITSNEKLIQRREWHWLPLHGLFVFGMFQ